MIKNYKYEDGLISERLQTRFLTISDAKAWSEFFEDKEAIQFLPKYENDDNHERAVVWIERQLDRYAEGRFGLQVLIDKTTGEFVGLCGLITQEVEGVSEIEVGYHIFKKHWGKGYAPEAAKLFINYAKKHDLSESVISIIKKNNIKSERVAAKNGLVKDRQLIWREMEVTVFRIYL